MNVDEHGSLQPNSIAMKYMMEHAAPPTPNPDPPELAEKLKRFDEAMTPGLRKYQGSFTIEPRDKTPGKIKTIHVTLEAADRDAALARLRTYASAENPGMACNRFQVGPRKSQ